MKPQASRSVSHCVALVMLVMSPLTAEPPERSVKIHSTPPGGAWTVAEVRTEIRRLPRESVREILTDPLRRPADLREAQWLRKVSPSSHPQAEYFLELLARYAELDFSSAGELISEHPEYLPAAVFEAVLRGKGRADGLPGLREAIDRTLYEPKGSSQWPWEENEAPLFISVIASVAQGWAERSPKAALKWTLECRGPELRYVIKGVILGLPQSTNWSFIWKKVDDMGEVKLEFDQRWSARNDYIFCEALAGRWIQSDPDAAHKWMLNINKQSGGWYFPEAFAAWMYSSPSSCIHWLEEHEKSGRFEDGELARIIYYSTRSSASRILPVLLDGELSKPRVFAIEALLDRRGIDEASLKKIAGLENLPP